MNGTVEKPKAVCYITARQLGLFETRNALIGSVRPIRHGEFDIPLYLKPPPASDDALVLLLAAIEMLRGSKVAEFKAWIALARKLINPAKGDDHGQP